MPDGEGIRAEVQTLKQDIGRLREDLGELLQSVPEKRATSGLRSPKHKEAMNRIDQFKDAPAMPQKACREAQKRIEPRPLATLLTDRRRRDRGPDADEDDEL